MTHDPETEENAVSELPEDAIEAAAKAEYERMAGDGLRPWSALPAVYRDGFRANVVTALAAALPFLERATRDNIAAELLAKRETYRAEYGTNILSHERVIDAIGECARVARGGEATE